MRIRLLAAAAEAGAAAARVPAAAAVEAPRKPRRETWPGEALCSDITRPLEMVGAGRLPEALFHHLAKTGASRVGMLGKCATIAVVVALVPAGMAAAREGTSRAQGAAKSRTGFSLS